MKSQILETVADLISDHPDWLTRAGHLNMLCTMVEDAGCTGVAFLMRTAAVLYERDLLHIHAETLNLSAKHTIQDPDTGLLKKDETDLFCTWLWNAEPEIFEAFLETVKVLEAHGLTREIVR